MKAKEGVVDLLNTALTIELTAINQYFLAAKQCESWGFAGLHAHFRRLSMEEMKDTEHLVEHILYLDGLPNLQDEETHVDWFETQLDTIRLVGLDHYLSQHITVD